MTIDRNDGPLLRAIRAADTSIRVQYHRDPGTRAYTHKSTLLDAVWHCNCGVDWPESDGKDHPW